MRSITITGVHSDTCVNLAFWDAEGNDGVALNVPGAPESEAPQVPLSEASPPGLGKQSNGYWAWPPIVKPQKESAPA